MTRALLAPLGLCACLPTQQISLEGLGDELLLVETADDEVATVTLLGGETKSLALSSRGSFTVIELQSFAELGIFGPFPQAVPKPERVRSLDGVVQQVLSLEEGEWVPRDEVPSGLFLPAFEYERCWRAGRCTITAMRSCVPCREVPVAAPDPPRAVDPPQTREMEHCLGVTHSSSAARALTDDGTPVIANDNEAIALSAGRFQFAALGDNVTLLGCGDSTLIELPGDVETRLTIRRARIATMTASVTSVHLEDVFVENGLWIFRSALTAERIEVNRRLEVWESSATITDAILTGTGETLVTQAGSIADFTRISVTSGFIPDERPEDFAMAVSIGFTEGTIRDLSLHLSGRAGGVNLFAGNVEMRGLYSKDGIHVARLLGAFDIQDVTAEGFIEDALKVESDDDNNLFGVGTLTRVRLTSPYRGSIGVQVDDEGDLLLGQHIHAPDIGLGLDARDEGEGRFESVLIEGEVCQGIRVDGIDASLDVTDARVAAGMHPDCGDSVGIKGEKGRLDLTRVRSDQVGIGPALKVSPVLSFFGEDLRLTSERTCFLTDQNKVLSDPAFDGVDFADCPVNVERGLQ